MKKRRFNQALSCVLALILIISMVPAVNVSAAETDITEVAGTTSSGLVYEISGGEVTITDYTGSATTLTIPSVIEGYPVTSIGEDAFYSCTSLTSITIPESVTSIGESAFLYSTSLTSITIPESVTSIGERAFFQCTSLANITIPSSITSIGNYVFSQCTSLANITIPESVTNIGEFAFSWCTSFTSITIPSSVTYIDDGVFYGCKSLTNITIPEGVISIGDDVFSWCGLTSITIPESVTSIGEDTFYSCTNLTSIAIPESVTSIGSSAFRSCQNLTSIVVDEENTAYDSRNNCNAIIETDTNILIAGCENTVIPSSVTSIGDYAFYGCKSLKSITIPSSVASIGDYAFYDCTNITSIAVDEENVVYDSRNNCNAIIETDTNTLIVGCENTVIPDGVTSIGDYAFYYYTSIRSIAIPSSVTNIGEYAFYDCTSLTSITIPSSVTSIGDSAFSSCTRLTDVYYGGTQTQWNAIEIGYGNDYLLNAEIHYESDYTVLSANSTNSTTISTSGQTKYYSFTPSTSGKYVIYSIGTSDTKVYLYDSQGNQLTYNDDADGSNNRNFRLEYNLTAGNTYYYGVKYYSDSTTGTISFKFGNVYTISYNANGGSGAPSAQYKDYGASITLSSIEPTRSGYEFLGWSTSSTSTTVSYLPGDTYSVDSDVILYAVWSYIDSTNPTVSISSTNNVASSQTATLTMSDNVGVVSYYWGTSSSPANSSFTSITSTKSYSTTRTVSSSGTYYLIAKDAQGNTAKTSVTFYKTTLNVNGGGSVSPTSILTKSGNTVTLPTPTRSGYVFVGWGPSTVVTVGSDISYAPENNSTLKAIWKYSPFGDVDENGVIDFEDVLLINKSIRDVSELDPWQTILADVNGDETVTMEDIEIINEFRLGKINTLPVDEGDIQLVINTFPDKTDYYVDDEISTEGLSVLLYCQGTITGYDVTNLCDVMVPDTATPGTKYIEISLKDKYSTRCSVVISEDSTNPTVSISSTNNVASSQTATLTMSDNVGVVSYYWGTSSSPASSSFTTITSSTSYTTTKTVSGSGTYYFIAKDAEGNTATTSVTFYSTTLNVNGGGSVSPTWVLVKSGNTITLPTPTRSGYTFNGWGTSSTSASGVTSVTVTSSKTYYAVWVPDTGVLSANASYNAVVSTGGQEVMYEFTPSTSGKYVIYSSSSYDTYVSLYNASGSQIEYNDDGGDNSNFRLESNLTAGTTYYYGVRYYNSSNTGTISFKFGNVYTISYNANGGSGAPSAQYKDYGTSITLSSTEPTRSGYEFLGWSASSFATTASYQPGGYYSEESDITLYAVWYGVDSTNPIVSVSSTNNAATSQTITLTMSDNVGVVSYYWGTSSSPASSSFTTITSSTSYITTKTVSGSGTYYFIAKDAEGNTSTTSIRFCSVTLDTNGGSVTPSWVLVKSGNTINLPTPEKSGYTFNGWGTSSTSASGVTSVTITSNKTYYATWSAQVQLVEVNALPKTKFYVGDYFERGGMSLKLIYADGSTQIVTSGFDTDFDDELLDSSGVYEVVVDYNGLTATYDIEVSEPSATIIPYAVTMDIGDTERLSVTLVPSSASVVYWESSNESVVTVEDGVVTAVSSGEAKIRAMFEYNGYRYSSNYCTVTVNEPAFAVNAYVYAAPAKQEYFIGDSLDTSGMVLAVEYSDGTTQKVSSGFTTGTFDSSSAGQKTVSVNYEGFVDYITVSVVTPVVTLSSKNLTVIEGKSASLTVSTTPADQTVTWHSSNTDVATVSDGQITAVASGVAVISATIVVNGRSYNASCAVVVPEVESVEIYTLPKTVYFLGEAMNTEGLELKVTYSDGSYDITSDYDRTNYSPKYVFTREGSDKIKVFYGNFSVSYDIEIKSMTVSLSESEFTLKIGEVVELFVETPGVTPEKYTWRSTNEKVATINNGTLTAVSAGTTEITVTAVYNKFACKSNKCVVTVIDPASVVEDVSVKSLPTKTEYFIGDEFDATGLELSVTYGDGSVKTVSSGFTVEGFDSDTAGRKNVVVKYEGFEATVTATVNTPKVELDVKNSLYVNETATVLVQTLPENCEVEWRSSDESVLTVTNGEVKALAKGTATITASINYNGVSYQAVCNIAVDEREWQFILGDANLDGEVNIKDATAIQKHIAQLEVLQQMNLMAADVDKSEDVNIKDATAIQKHIAGIETGYLVGKSE